MNADGFGKNRVMLFAQYPQGVKATIVQIDAPGPLVAEMTGQGRRNGATLECRSWRRDARYVAE